MPSSQMLVRLSNGQTLMLGPQDRVVKEITIQCESPRCGSRHETDKPVEFTFDDQGAFPEAGDSYISLILPERSPSNPGGPRCFCSPICVKDYLVYAYIAPSPRQPEPDLTADQLVRKTDSVEPEPVVIGQADGSGE